MSTQLLGNRFDFARGHALHLPLPPRRDECLLAALRAFKDLGAKAPWPVLGHESLDRADPRYQHPAVIAGAVAETGGGPFAFARLEGLFPFGFPDLLHRLLPNHWQQIPGLR